MNLLYGKILAGILLVLSIFYAGWHMRDVEFMAFKKEVENTAKAQEAYNTSIQKQQDIVTKGIKNDYESKLAAVRNYYSGMQLNPSSRPVSGISAAPKGTDAETAYPILAGQCSQSTLMLVELQEWIRQQSEIK